MQIEQLKEDRLQRLMRSVASTKKGPQEHWQVRLLRTLPPERVADEVYGKGTTWEEEMARRRQQRHTNVMLYLEDRPAPLLLTDMTPAEKQIQLEKEMYVGVVWSQWSCVSLRRAPLCV